MRFRRHKGKGKKDNEGTVEYVCSKCGADVSIDDTNCPNCGEDISEIEEDYTCNNCGGDVSEEDTICPFCGEDVSEIVDEPVKEFRKRISIFSLKPTKSKDGGGIMTTVGLFYLIGGFVLLITSVIVYATIDKNHVYNFKIIHSSFVGITWGVVMLTSGIILLILGMYAKRGIVFYLYIGLLILFIHFVMFLINAEKEYIIFPFVISYAIFGSLIWLLIKSTPAYRNWYKKRMQSGSFRRRLGGLIRKLRGRMGDFEE